MVEMKYGDASIPRVERIDVGEKAVGSCVERGSDACLFPRKL